MERVALLDVNVLVALFDVEHLHHEVAHHWFGRNRRFGWATCPLTENGLVRILSHEAYGGRRTTLEDTVERFSRFQESGDHHFWPDSVTIRDRALFEIRHIQGPRQLTDAYLLALCVRHGGRLATLDRSIPARAVIGASAEHLAQLSLFPL